ncbi:MAG: twin transmembrane helix small protein [Acetobacteraceae bacterium]
MRGFFIVVIGLLMLGTLGVLIAGMVGMTQSNADPHRSNRLMRWRVILQGAALLFLAALMLLLRP